MTTDIHRGGGGKPKEGPGIELGPEAARREHVLRATQEIIDLAASEGLYDEIFADQAAEVIQEAEQILDRQSTVFVAALGSSVTRTEVALGA